MEFRRVLFRSIGYTLKDAWRRSAHSTQTIRVMPDTRGRGTGEAVSPSWTVRKSRDDESHLWRAVCAERGTHGSERANWKRASCLLYLVGGWFDHSWAQL